jgi:hypothetical protein
MAQIQPPNFTTLGAGEIRPRVRFRVLKKLRWADAWKVVPYLEVVEFTDCAAPSMPSATFRYRFGKITREDRSTGTFFNAMELRDWYVQIEQLPPEGALRDGNPTFTNGQQNEPIQRWVGRFTDESLQTLGKARSSRGVGAEFICACGLAQELDKNVLASSVCTNDGTTTIRIDELLVFNDDLVAGYVETGNRSAARITDPTREGYESYVFSNEKTGAGQPYRWSAKDIAEYLLTWHAPPEMKFKLAGDLELLANLSAFEPPEFRVAGCTIFEALNRLFDRRRGLTWSIRPPRAPQSGQEAGDDAEAFEIWVSSTVDEDVVFDDYTLTANPDVISIPVRSLEHLIKEHELRLDVLAAYDKIVVSGERVLVCCTVSPADGTLEKAWDSDLENTYKAGLRSTTGDTGSERSSEAIDEARKDDYWDRVYRAYRIPKTWGFSAGNGTSGTKSNVSISLTNEGRLNMASSAPAAPVRNWGHRIARHLPLRSSQISGGWENNVAPDYRAPFVLVKKADGTYQYSEKVEVKGNGSLGNVTPLDQDFGLHVSASPNHVLAKNVWNSGATPSASKFNPDGHGFDYREMIATVAFHTDARLRVVVEVSQIGGGMISPGTAERTLQIDVPNTELWWIAPNTVIGRKDNGELDYTLPSTIPATRIVRDDSERLRKIAALAKAWYGTRRAGMSLLLHDASQSLPIGTYVRSVQDVSGFESINSVVTCVRYDAVNQTTQIQTQFAELDVVAGFGHTKALLR